MAAQVPQDVKQLLMGGHSTQFNLATVRSRAEDLRRGVQEVLDALACGATLRWADFLKKFTVINVQLASLRETLRGVLKQVVVHPRMVDAPAVAAALPIQLASKLTPEMEAAEAATVADAEAAQAAREGGARSGTGDAGSLAALSAMRYEQVSSEIDEFNRFIASLSQPDGPLHPQCQSRKAIEQASRVNRAMATDGRATLLAGSSAPGAGAAASAPAAKRQRVGANDAKAAALDPELAMLLFGDRLPRPK